MDPTTSWNTSGVDIQTVREQGRCAICRRRTLDSMFALQECLNLPVAPQTWLLCEGCAAAVVTEMARSQLNTPLRVRVAVGIVASRRKPRRHHRLFDREYWEQMPAEQLDMLVVYCMLLTFLIPPLVFLLLTVLLTSGIPGVGP